MRPKTIIFPFIIVLTTFVAAVLDSMLTDVDFIFEISALANFLACVFWAASGRNNLKKQFGQKKLRILLTRRTNILLITILLSSLMWFSTQQDFEKSIDVTGWGANTLSSTSLTIIDQFKKYRIPIKTKAYFTSSEDENLFRKLLRFYSDQDLRFTVEYLNPNIEVIQAKADKVSTKIFVIFEHENKKATIQSLSEEKISNALASLIKANNKRVCFTLGHGEAQIDDSSEFGISQLKTMLEANQYKVSATTLSKDRIDMGCNTVVMISPKVNPTILNIQKIQEHLLAGGSAIILVDAIRPVNSLNSVTEKFGLKWNSDFLILKSEDSRTNRLGKNTTIIDQFDAGNPVTTSLSKNILMLSRDTRSISLLPQNDYHAKAKIIGAASSGFSIENVYTVNDLKDISQRRLKAGVHGVVGYSFGAIDKNSGDNKTFKLAVAGSSQFVLNRYINEGPNRDLIQNMIAYLSGRDEFVAIRPREDRSGALLTSTPASLLTLAGLSFLYPLLILLGGLVTFTLRR